MDINSKVFDAPREQIQEALGLLPHWVLEYNFSLESRASDDLVQWMADRYGFGELYKFGGYVTEDGNYCSEHEDDDDLPWIAKMKTRDGDVYFYEYAITALPTPDGYYITRMD